MKEMREGFVQKHCPKCGGNVYLDRDYYGWYERCLQCAYTRDLINVAEVRGEMSQGNPRTASRKHFRK
jgi:hypothetical protein